ncbi:MAG: wax ester/triacylglycerol synthase domain-containing protein, partial [Propionicimonas sp.]|nr:wax ester/triacylglycerol synthase family O-acyltransferase [Propionicimonas sp.]
MERGSPPPAGAGTAAGRRQWPIERASSEDLMSLAGDSGTVPMQVGGVLFVRTTPGWRPEDLVDALAARIPAVPRLRQRLHRVAPGLGRPVWQDDPGFGVARHLAVARCSGGREGVLDLAADLLVARLPADRPLWAARVVTGFAPD